MQIITNKSSTAQTTGRIVLGLFLMLAGTGHLSFQRQEFTAQVPDWLPLAPDLAVVLSGIIEILLGALLIFLSRYCIALGWVAATFFVAVFPGNIAQFVGHKNAFGLDTDTARGIRLLFQPVLIVWALWCTGAWRNRSQKIMTAK